MPTGAGGEIIRSDGKMLFRPKIRLASGTVAPGGPNPLTTSGTQIAKLAQIIEAN